MLRELFQGPISGNGVLDQKEGILDENDSITARRSYGLQNAMCSNHRFVFSSW